MPIPDVGDRTPGRHCCPEIRTSSRKQQGTVSSARTAAEIDPFFIDICGFADIADRIFEIGDHEIGTACFGPPVRAAEFGENKIPVALLANGRKFFVMIGMIITPGMQSHQKRTGIIPFRRPKHGGLAGLVYLAVIKDFPDHWIKLLFISSNHRDAYGTLYRCS